MGSALQRLAQGRMGLTPGPEEDSLSLVSPSSPAKYFSASGARGREALPGPPGGLWADPSRPPTDENLIRQILAEGASSLAPTQDTQGETDLLAGL